MSNKASNIIIAVSTIAATIFIFSVIYMVDISGGDNAKFLAALFPSENKDNFIDCLAEKEVVFYGLYGDNETEKQKEIFSNKDISTIYKECLEEESGDLLFECQIKGILNYPTWVIEGERHSQVLSLKELSELSDCQIEK